MTTRRIDPDRDAGLDAGPETDVDARWGEQERLRKAVAAGAVVTQVDRALFGALASEALPSLPETFAAAVATTAERYADARRRVARFRALSLRLFGLLYLPAIAVVTALFASDLPAMWARQAPEQRAPLLWTVILASLCAGNAFLEHLRARRRPPIAPP